MSEYSKKKWSKYEIEQVVDAVFEDVGIGWLPHSKSGYVETHGAVGRYISSLLMPTKTDKIVLALLDHLGLEATEHDILIKKKAPAKKGKK